jgi:hypothetical protein
MGEVAHEDRLLYDPVSPHVGVNFGAVADRMYIGKIDAPRHYTGILMQDGRVDLDPDWFE